MKRQRIEMKANRWILGVLLIFIIFAFSEAHAVFYSGNKLVTIMREYEKFHPNTFFEVGEYMGYILGVYDTTKFLYSTPDNVTAGQIMAIVSKYLKNNPEKWGEPAYSLVINALQEAFPLKNTK